LNTWHDADKRGPTGDHIVHERVRWGYTCDRGARTVIEA
jgi:hypothetical protein